MCGIAGIMTRDGSPPDPAVIARLLSSLGHRGPDGAGHYRAGNLAMIHLRLAIIDVAGGDQPLHEAGGAALIANGEIYNYLELKELLPKAQFTTGSDCEVPLHLYRKYGLAFVNHLRGMYALALHDPASGRLMLVRDPFGIKPLYYTEGSFGLAFASEPHAFIEAGLVTPEILPRVRGELLQLQFTTGRETIYAGIHRVLPGETLVVADGRIVERRRREALPAGPPYASHPEAALHQLDAVLHDSVLLHQRSDVPYGMFLSSGIDSAALLRVMRDLNPKPVTAFTIGFIGGSASDERPAARQIAGELGAEHIELAFSEQDFWQLLPAVVAAADDPVADYAILPTWKLAAAARQHGLKVILCGEGGDELFAGYGRYRSVMRPWWAGGKLLHGRGNFDGLNVLNDSQTGWRDGIMASEVQAETGGRSRLQIAQAVDCADWLPNDLLTKLDRCLMAHGVEGRTPFLDPVVAELAFRLPDGLKIRDHLGKWLLRRWLHEKLPHVDVLSRKKGFTVPISDWLRRRARDVAPLLARQPAIREICQLGAVEALFQRLETKHQGFAAWTLLFYALWHRIHIERVAPQEDALTTLAAS